MHTVKTTAFNSKNCIVNLLSVNETFVVDQGCLISGCMLQACLEFVVDPSFRSNLVKVESFCSQMYSLESDYMFDVEIFS